MNEINKFCEFSVQIAKKYGIEIAIIHGFFKKVHYLNSIQENSLQYPSIQECCVFLDFWDEQKIRELIAELYTKKLI